NASSYPLTVYGVAGLALLTICMPVGLATFFPAEEAFGRLPIGEFFGFLILEIIAAYAYYKISSFLITKYSSGGG
ncbi:MAG: ABC-2 family transporter protein, partial [Candidatus Micrarchaeia archaeon]